MADDRLERAVELIHSRKVEEAREPLELMPGIGHTVTKDGVKLTIDLFRKTIRK
ncbi:MAG TPA: hypothetical protein VF896_19405 [Anaerolineales bacterium]